MKIFSASWHNDRLYLNKESPSAKNVCTIIPKDRKYEVIYDNVNFICQIKERIY